MSSGFTDFRVQKAFPSKMPKRETGEKELNITGDAPKESQKTTPAAGILKHISRFYPKKNEKDSKAVSELSSDRNGGAIGVG